MTNSGLHDAIRSFDGAHLRAAAENLLPPEWRRPESPLRLSGQITAPGALVEIVSMLVQSGRSGTLIAAAGDDVRAVAFENGTLVGAATTRATERIGHWLRREGEISLDELDAAAFDATVEGCLIGELLVARGRLDQDTLEALLVKHAEEIFLGILRVETGAFCFFDDVIVPRIHGARTVLSLVMEATRRIEALSTYRRTIGGLSSVPKACPNARGTVADDLADVLARCDGSRTIGDIAEAIGAFEFEIMEAVHRLATSELVEITTVRSKSERINANYMDMVSARARGVLQSGLGRAATPTVHVVVGS